MEKGLLSVINVEKHIKECTLLLEENPDDKTAMVVYCIRGWEYAESGKYDLAISDFNTVIDNPDTKSAGYYFRTYAYYCKGERNLAYCDYVTAIKFEMPDKVMEAIPTYQELRKDTATKRIMQFMFGTCIMGQVYKMIFLLLFQSESVFNEGKITTIKLKKTKKVKL